MRETVGQIFRFAVVGGFTTLLYIALGLVFQNVGRIPAVPASVLAYCIAAFVSFLGHRIVTFASDGPPVRQGKRFVAVVVLGLGCAFILPLVAGLFGAPNWVGLILVGLVIPPFNFFALRFMVFSEW